jgi:hypothetical protein
MRARRSSHVSVPNCRTRRRSPTVEGSDQRRRIVGKAWCLPITPADVTGGARTGVGTAARRDADATLNPFDTNRDSSFSRAAVVSRAGMRERSVSANNDASTGVGANCTPWRLVTRSRWRFQRSTKMPANGVRRKAGN